ncbi:MAG: complex I subunit 5 family protein [Lachnospiraceae bacterium]|nr:complex I subunit 5 family protein [Lachnospiraceae bacterium]
MLAAFVSYGIGRKNKDGRSIFADIITGLTFLLCVVLTVQMLTGMAGGTLLEIPYVCGMGLHFTLDGFRALYGTIAAFMWFMTTLFSKEYFGHYRNRNRYYLFLLLTLGATEGVFFSADFFTTFLFFEIMSFTSYVWVVHDERPESLRAGATYLAVAVIGGLVMLMGIFLLYHTTGTLNFEELAGCYEKYALLSSSGIPKKRIQAAGLCLLFGFGAKAGAFPLHIWLPKAHPVAPAPASALLSGILTKAGMYGILILTVDLFFGSAAWGDMILILGVFTMVIGAVLALFSVDLKRTLACSSVSQIGFILVGVGMSGLLGAENTIALRGSLLHMVNHSLIKLVLFMAAGVVFMNVHKLDLNEIRGFGRKKPLLQFIFLMGVLGISGVPLFNGYVSKTLLHESIVEYMFLINADVIPAFYSTSFMSAVEWVFLFSGGLTAAYMTKLYVCLFVEKNTDDAVQKKYDLLKGKYMNRTSAAALTVSAVILPSMGLLPGIIMDGIADMGQSFLRTGTMETVSYFSLDSLKGALISLVLGALIYGLIVRFVLMKNRRSAATIQRMLRILPKWFTLSQFTDDIKKSSAKTLDLQNQRNDIADKYYVNLWPAWMDLENLIYRPLLLKILPFAFGMLCRFLDSLVDTIVVVLRKTVYRDEKLPHERPEGNLLTHLAACAASFFERLNNLLLGRKNPKKQDFEHKLALIHEEWSENATMIARSMSFGLLLFCVGLILTVAYLFVKDVFGL